MKILNILSIGRTFLCINLLQSFCRVLEAAISDGGDMLALHLDHLLNDLYDKVQFVSTHIGLRTVFIVKENKTREKSIIFTP
jgi:hypothetical protein